jgi:hypothetical protein
MRGIERSGWNALPVYISGSNGITLNVKEIKKNS